MARRPDDLWVGVQHYRVRHEVAYSPAWRVMGYSSRALYADLRVKLTSTNNGDIDATIETMKHFGWSSPVTLSKALFELETMGFIAVVRRGGQGGKNGICSLYRFTDMPMFEMKPNAKTGFKGRPYMGPTFEYRQFDEGVSFAERALADAYSTKVSSNRKGRAAALATDVIRAAKNTKSLQIVKRATTETVVVEAETTTENVAWRSTTTTENVACEIAGSKASKASARIQASEKHATETVRLTYNYQTSAETRPLNRGQAPAVGYVRCRKCPAQFRPVDWLEHRRLGFCSNECYLARHQKDSDYITEPKGGSNYQDRHGRKIGQKLIDGDDDAA